MSTVDVPAVASASVAARRSIWPDVAIPLRLARGRFWGWGIFLAVAGLAVIGNSPNVRYVDFPQFWAAARTVGTPDLLDPVRHGAWELRNAVPQAFFAYPPGTAWLFAPFAWMPLGTAFWVHALAMAAITAAAGALGARVFGLSTRVGLLAAFAWAPCMASIAFGQNGPLGLLFLLVAIEGLRRDDELVVGAGVGLLLYKPTLALPMIALLLLRRRWRALGLVAGAGAIWLLMGVAATAGDWAWPSHWLSELSSYYAGDTTFNAGKATSIAGILIGYGAPAWLAWSLSLAVIAAAVPRLLRAPLVEAAAGVSLLGLAVSPHSLNYEAAVALPAIFWAMGAAGSGLAEPARTRLIVAAYVVVSLHLISTYLGISSVAVAILAAAAIWILGIWRVDRISWRALGPWSAQGSETVPLRDQT